MREDGETESSGPAAAGLEEAIRRRTSEALDTGLLQPIETDRRLLRQGDLEVLVSVAREPRRDPARGSGRGAGSNPFLPYEQDLVVAELSDTHVCLLNRYPVIEGHLLLITRTFEDQLSLLTLADFEALWMCLAEIDGLAFYNAGSLAGASQPHKHLQIVPLPLVGLEERFPTAALIEGSAASGAIAGVEKFGFRHALAGLGLVPGESERCDSGSSAAQTLLNTYLQLRTRAGLEDPARPYSLLASRAWMLLVPRAHPDADGVEINALGFAGSLFLREPEQLEVVERLGLLKMLASVSSPSASPSPQEPQARR